MTASRPPSSSIDLSTGKKILEELNRRLPEHVETWFRRIDFRGVRTTAEGEQVCCFTAPSGLVRDWVLRNFLPELKAAVDAALDTPHRVQIVVVGPRAAQSGDEPTAEEASPDPPADADQHLYYGVPTAAARHVPVAADAAPARRPPGPLADQVQQIVDGIQQRHEAPLLDLPLGDTAPASLRTRTVLNRNFVFEEFVVADSNRLAHAAAMAAGSSPGCAYNPLFVQANPGLGKTHLLQAICHAVLRMQPNSRVFYVNCEDFTNQFIDASKNRQLEAFRARYRSADVLVIDDIEFLANKGKTQIEFFHTFDALYNAHKQIVLSSHRRPLEIPALLDRLVSRFKWGLETTINPPCVGLRAAIVRRKAAQLSATMPDEVAHFIAETVTTNIRELEGAIINVLGHAKLANAPIDLPLAMSALNAGTIARRAKTTLSATLALVSSEFSTPAKELTGKSRAQAVCLPRQIGMYLARKHTDHSLEDIGRFFGGRDHTTVLYAVKKITERLAKDRGLLGLIDQLSARLSSGPPAAQSNGHHG